MSAYDWNDRDVQLYIQYRQASFDVACNPTNVALGWVCMKAYADYVLEEAFLNVVQRKHL